MLACLHLTLLFKSLMECIVHLEANGMKIVMSLKLNLSLGAINLVFIEFYFLYQRPAEQASRGAMLKSCGTGIFL